MVYLLKKVIFHGKLLNIQMVSPFIILLTPWKSKGRSINEGVENNVVYLWRLDDWMVHVDFNVEGTEVSTQVETAKAGPKKPELAASNSMDLYKWNNVQLGMFDYQRPFF